MSYTNLPYLYEGEIVSVLATPYASKKNMVRYTIRVTMPNGSDLVIPNAVEASMFGGIDDYFQQRARASKDSGNKFEPSGVDAQNDARIGQRCYVMFVGGSLAAPVIVAWQQHPNQTAEFESPEEIDPQAVLKYLGMRFDFKDDGTFRITHFGAPEIKMIDTSFNLASLASGAAAAAVGSALGALGDEAPNPIEPDKKNGAVVPADAKKRTFVEFNTDGGFEIRDALSQVIHIDTTEKRILIANNETSGPDDTTEYVVLDRTDKKVGIGARELIEMISLGDWEDKIDGDYTHSVAGDESATIEGDKTETIEGDSELSVTGDFNGTVGGDETIEISGDADHTYKGDLTETIGGDQTVEVTGSITKKTQAGATLSLDGATVAFGANGTELLKTVSDGLQLMADVLTAIQSLTVTTSMGPSGPPINLADFVQLGVKVNTLKGKLDAITGSI